MINIERAKELSNLVAVMVEEGNDAYDIIAEVKTAIIETQNAINVGKIPKPEEPPANGG